MEARKLRIEKEENEKREKERQEELRIAKEKAEKERIEREKERRQQKRITTVIGIAAVFSIAFAVFGFVNMNKAEKEQERTQQLTIKGNLKDGKTYIKEEKYEEAMNKFLYLRDTILEGQTTEEIQEQIKYCKEQDSPVLVLLRWAV